MLKSRQMLLMLSAFLFFAAVVSACSGEQLSESSQAPAGNEPNSETSSSQAENYAEAEDVQEPVKVTAYSYWREFSDDYWKQVLINPVKEKHPHIDLEIIIPKDGNGTNHLKELIVANEAPDLVISDIGTAPGIAELGYNYDMTELVANSDIDMVHFDQNVLEYIRALDVNGGLITMPYSSNFIALFYNKDIFDRFGQEYPYDGITFPEVVELARNLTRTEDNQKYIGFDHNSIHFLAGGITRDFFDPETGLANLSTPEWRMAYELLVELIHIPGNRFPGEDDYHITRWHNEAFYRDQYVAMAGVPNLISAGLQTVPDMNWDMTAYPVFEDFPRTAQAAGGRGLFLNPASDVLEDAFKVIEAALSEENQIIISSNGEQPALVTERTIEAFCSNLPYTEGKNVKAAFYNKQNYPTNPTIYDGYAIGIVYNHSLELYQGKDINTVIRETEEAINQKVRELSGQ